jgi:hypothetical protein
MAIRAAHGSTALCTSAWSYALPWNAVTGRTTGYLDGMRKSDRDDLALYTQLSSGHIAHPITLPEVALHMIVSHLNEGICIPSEHEFDLEERRVGLSLVHHLHLEQAYDIWKWDFGNFQQSTFKANRFIATVAYTKRRLAFASQLARCLLTVMEELEAHDFGDTKITIMISNGKHQRRERLVNKVDMLERYSHQSKCVQMRAENLISVVIPTSNVCYCLFVLT